MARPDANVQRFVKENDTAARNEAMLSTMHATQQVSAWHEKQYHKTGGATVGGARADLKRRFETSGTWRTRQSYLAPFFDIGLWPWEGQCADTGFNATVAVDEGVYLVDFPAFILIDDKGNDFFSSI